MKELKSTSRTFLIGSEDMCIHIVKTGFSQSQNYLVTYEDAYQELLGKTDLMSRSEIQKKFGVSL